MGEQEQQEQNEGDEEDEQEDEAGPQDKQGGHLCRAHCQVCRRAANRPVRSPL